jgi:raffinose/stachyose/melibiose transport system permease protein
MNKNEKYTVRTFIGEAAMLVVCAFFVIPIYYLVVSTFKNQKEIMTSPLALPSSFTLDNYRKALATMDFWRNFGNSLFITVCSVIVIIVFGSMAAYAVSRRKNKVTGFISWYFIIGFMVPLQTTMLPLFTIMRSLHMINTFRGMIFLHSNQVAFAYFMYRSFMSTVPKELEEAAQIDGAGLLTTFWVVVFPLLKPVTATLVIFNTMWIWNDFLLTYLFLSSTKKATLIMQVYNGVCQFSNDWSIMMPALVLALLPMVIFYLIMQKHIIGGLTVGSVKG